MIDYEHQPDTAWNFEKAISSWRATLPFDVMASPAPPIAANPTRDFS
jgi:hypothetical protein